LKLDTFSSLTVYDENEDEEDDDEELLLLSLLD